MKIASVLQIKPLTEEDDTTNPITKLANEYHLPEIQAAGVVALLVLPDTMKLTGKAISKAIPGLGAILQLGTTWNLASKGRWSDAFLSAGLTAVNIGQFFGYAAGGVPGGALAVTDLAGNLWIDRLDYIRLYYKEIEGIDLSQVPDEKLDAAATELTNLMALQLAEDIGNGILDAVGMGEDTPEGTVAGGDSRMGDASTGATTPTTAPSRDVTGEVIPTKTTVDKPTTPIPTSAVARSTTTATAPRPVAARTTPAATPEVARTAPAQPVMVPPNYDDLSFKQAFARARASAKQIDPDNPGSFSFTWKGKPYQTNIKGERFIPKSKQRQLLVPQVTSELTEGKTSEIISDALPGIKNIWGKIKNFVAGGEDAAGATAKGADNVDDIAKSADDVIGSSVKALPTEHVIDGIKYTYNPNSGKWIDPTNVDVVGGRIVQRQIPEASLQGRELYQIRSPKIDAAAKAADAAAGAGAGVKDSSKLAGKLSPEAIAALKSTPVEKWTVEQLASLGYNKSHVPLLSAARSAGIEIVATGDEMLASPWWKAWSLATGAGRAAFKGSTWFADKTLKVVFWGWMVGEAAIEGLNRMADLDPNDPNYTRRVTEIWVEEAAKVGTEILFWHVAGALSKFGLRKIGVAEKWPMLTALVLALSKGAGAIIAKKYAMEGGKLTGGYGIQDIVEMTSDFANGSIDRSPGAGTLENTALYKKAYKWALDSGATPESAKRYGRMVAAEGPNGPLSSQLDKHVPTFESVQLAYLYNKLDESTNARNTIHIHNIIKRMLAESSNSDVLERSAYIIQMSGILNEDANNDNFMTNVTAAIAANTKGDKVGAQKALDAAKLSNPATGTDQTNQKNILDQLVKANPGLSVPNANPNATQTPNQTPNPNSNATQIPNQTPNTNSTQTQTPNPNATQSNVEEAGAFSYGKKPRKGTVAYNAAEQRKRAEKNEKPIEPKDQMVGTAKVKKDNVEEAGGIGGGVSGGAIHGQSVGNAAAAEDVLQAYNEFAAKYPAAKLLLDIMPITGTATSVIDASQDFRNGKYGQAAIDMLGALPGFKIGKYLSRGLQTAIKSINRGAKLGNAANATTSYANKTIGSTNSDSVSDTPMSAPILESPKMGDHVMLELADGRVIVAPISELRGNSMIVALDETGHQWLDESPSHDALKIGDGTQALSSTAQFWNSMIDTLTHDTPAGWAQLFVNLQNTTGHVARTMPHQWANIWRQQHIQLGDEITRGDMMAWVNEVESAIDNSGLEESSLNPAGGSKLRKMLDSKDPAMLAVWMSSRAGSKGVSVAKFTKDKAVQSGLPANHWWNKIKNLVNETADPYSMEKRYYIVRKTSSAAPVDGISGFHRKSEADKKLATMKNPNQYMVRAIDSTTLPKDEMKESRRSGDVNFSPEDIAVIAGLTDLEDAKKHAIRLITRNSRRPMTADKIKWFTHHINNSKSVRALTKMMYDMLLSGEGLSVIGSVGGMNPNSYRQTFKEDDGIDDDEEELYYEAIDSMDNLYYALTENNFVEVANRLSQLGRLYQIDGVYLPSAIDMVTDRKVKLHIEKLHGLLSANIIAVIRGILQMVKQHGADNEEIINLISVLEEFGIEERPELTVLSKGLSESIDETDIAEAEYKGKTVPLSKPIRTSPSEGGKFKVYVKDPKTGNIKMVRFGDTTGLSIKRDDPKRRKNYRARHHCENPGPKTKANYWSCKMWTAKPVGKILKGK